MRSLYHPKNAVRQRTYYTGTLPEGLRIPTTDKWKYSPEDLPVYVSDVRSHAFPRNHLSIIQIPEENRRSVMQWIKVDTKKGTQLINRNMVRNITFDNK